MAHFAPWTKIYRISRLFSTLKLPFVLSPKPKTKNFQRVSCYKKASRLICFVYYSNTCVNITRILLPSKNIIFKILPVPRTMLYNLAMLVTKTEKKIPLTGSFKITYTIKNFICVIKRKCIIVGRHRKMHTMRM